MKGINRLF